MPADDEKRSSERERDIARKRDELLAEARGEKPKGLAISGADPRLMGLGVQFVVAILLALYAGMWVDAKLRSTPWFTLIGGMVGAGAGFYSMWRVLVDVDKKLDDEKKNKSR
jgi:F0F1-type ATP synthase assembly protein I